ncbi:MAG TPA: hypothetical protein VEC60_02985 [Reyranella sp.]|nr:hypothetical protein [Reyranella sp.]
MPDPFRLRVLKALTLALQEIEPSNGYDHDLSEAVFRGRLYFGNGDPLPMVSILEPNQDSSPVADGGGNVSGNWTLHVQGFVKDDPKNPTDPAHKLMADVLKRLAIEAENRLNGRTLNILGMGGGNGKGNEIEKLTIENAAAYPPQSSAEYACFSVILTFRLVEDLKDPFA